MTRSRQPMCFVATSDPKAAARFYGEVLGLTLVEHSPYALVFDDVGVTLRVQVVEAFEPAAFTVHGWQVTDITQEVAKLTAKGVVFERFTQLEQDAMGVWSTPDGARIAWFKDPCGNVLSLTESA